MPNRSAKFVEVPGHAMPEKPGETSIRGNRFVICCPCGCGDIIGIRVAPAANDPGPVWSWNGDRARPTITPSIRVIGGCNWHGFLTDGEYREC